VRLLVTNTPLPLSGYSSGAGLTFMLRSVILILSICIYFSMSMSQGRAETKMPERVSFLSADNRTTLIGYLYKPSIGSAKAPAIVMMHGRAGAYSSRANGVYDASTLSKRHQAWGELLAREGYFALMADGFGPRGYPRGFGPHSYNDRPEQLNEVTIRPLDAYGAASFLRTLPGVAKNRIGLLGWSNGGSATISAISADAPGRTSPAAETGFRAAAAFYPACALKDKFKDTIFLPYAPLLLFHGLADEETSARRCAALVERSKAQGMDIAITLYPGATHGFDDPSVKRQSVEANAAATKLAVAKTLSFFAEHLRQSN
jgi:dienelactone hydrolase